MLAFYYLLLVFAIDKGFSRSSTKMLLQTDEVRQGEYKRPLVFHPAKSPVIDKNSGETIIKKENKETISSAVHEKTLCTVLFAKVSVSGRGPTLSNYCNPGQLDRL